MPIRFLCEHCQQRLSVGSRKAGAVAKCPKCKQRVTVPETQEEAESQEQNPPTPPTEDSDEHHDEGSEDALSQFAVFDQDYRGMELVYEDEPSESRVDDRPLLPVDPNKLAVPRQVLYMQGILLGAVALVGFAFGVVVGSATSSSTTAGGPPQPCEVAGRVTFRNGEQVLPDEGAVVVILPQDIRPEEKAPVEGLVPSMPFPDDRDPGLRSIHSVGGEYTRADVNGEFRVRVANTGKYFVLVLSGNAQRSPNDELVPRDIAQLGRFFMPAPDLIGQNRYQWNELTLLRDRRWDVQFD